MSVARTILTVVCLLTLSSVGSYGSILFSVQSGGTLTATVVNQISPPAFLGLDYRGSTAVAEFDSVTSSFFGAALVSDLTNPPFPNSTLFAENFSATETVMLVPISVDLEGQQLLVSEFGSPVGNVSDPSLLAFTGNLLFTYDFITTTSDSTFSASYFGLSAVESVPEPTAFVLAAFGLFGIAIIRKRFCRT